MKENKGKEPCIFCAFILDWLTPMDCHDTINMIGIKIKKKDAIMGELRLEFVSSCCYLWRIL